MLKLIRRDLSLIFANWQVGVLLLLLMPFLLLFIGAEKVNEAILANVLILGYFLTVLPFSYELRIKPYLLIQSLPISRSEVVISRYISTFINLIIGTIYSVIYLWIINKFKVLNVDTLNIKIIIEAFLIVILGLSISLPGFFILSPKGGTILNTAVYIIGLNFYFIQPGTNFRRYNISNKFGIAIMVSYIISLGLSIWFYERKDLV